MYIFGMIDLRVYSYIPITLYLLRIYIFLSFRYKVMDKVKVIDKVMDVTEIYRIVMGWLSANNEC